MAEILENVGNFFSGGTYLTIGIISLVLLLIGWIFDGLFDTLGFGDGWLSLTTVGAFGAGFGFVGFMAVSSGQSDAVAALLGGFVGLLVAIGSWLASRFFQKSESSASISSSSILGVTAVVDIPIPGGDLPGEISYYTGGMRHSYIAYAKERIESGERVCILDVRGGAAVNVGLIKEQPID